METELGERLSGEDRCTACQDAGEECWVYSKRGSRQVSRPGGACTRCRVVARPGGCSNSKRKRKCPKDLSLADRPVYRALVPSGGPTTEIGRGDSMRPRNRRRTDN